MKGRSLRQNESAPKDQGAKSRGKDKAGYNKQVLTGPTPRKPRPPDPDVGSAIALLAETWPKCFSVYQNRRRPLKVGIRKDISAALNGALTDSELGIALACYTANAGYQSRLRQGAWRYDLDGNVAGAVTKEEEVQARGSVPVRQKKATAKGRRA